jgi:hypothetical protein
MMSIKMEEDEKDGEDAKDGRWKRRKKTAENAGFIICG